MTSSAAGSAALPKPAVSGPSDALGGMLSFEAFQHCRCLSLWTLSLSALVRSSKS